jgi:hypothetical protein
LFIAFARFGGKSRTTNSDSGQPIWWTIVNREGTDLTVVSDNCVSQL